MTLNLFPVLNFQRAYTTATKKLPKPIRTAPKPLDPISSKLCGEQLRYCAATKPNYSVATEIAFIDITSKHSMGKARNKYFEKHRYGAIIDVQIQLQPYGQILGKLLVGSSVM